MATLNEYRLPTPDWLYVAVERESYMGDARLRVGVRTMDADALLVDVPLRTSLRSAGAVENDAQQLLQQVIEQATVQLATMELERN